MEETNLENKEVLIQAEPVNKPQNNNNQTQIMAAIIIAGLLIAGAILLKDTTPAVNTKNNNAGTETKARPVSSSDHILGNINAKIIIVEYSDLECPYCQIFHRTMHKVVENSNGDVAWVFRHYPIPELHPKAPHEAEATECAWEQGGNDAFWKYTDRVFEITPSNNKLEVAELSKIAEYVGLNVPSFNTCLNSGKFKEKVTADIEDGIKAGVNGTPSSFILQEGKVIETIPGAQSYETIMQRLDTIK
jgi:protein-disulfide isomerase